MKIEFNDMDSQTEFLCNDKCDNPIYRGDGVFVPEPMGNTDMWQHRFTGIAADMHGEYLTIEDSDGSSFDVSPTRLLVEVV